MTTRRNWGLAASGLGEGVGSGDVGVGEGSGVGEDWIDRVNAMPMLKGPLGSVAGSNLSSPVAPIR